MNYCKMVRDFKIRTRPDRNSSYVGPTLVSGTNLLILEEVAGSDGPWLEVVASLSYPARGFVPSALTRDSDPPTAPNFEIDLDRFVRSCTRAAQSINAPHIGKKLGVNRDFLISLAWVQSKIEHKTTTLGPATAVGPFQFTEYQWEYFLRNLGGAVEGYTSEDRHHPYMQCYAAASVTFSILEALSIELTPEPEPGDGPFIPNSIEIFLAQLTGVTSSLAFIQAKDPKADAASTLKWNLSGKPEEVDQIAAAAAAYLTDGAGKSRTIGEVITEIDARLNEGFDKAFDLTQQYLPDEPVIAQTTAPPWMAIAEAELAKKPPIVESGSPPNPEIIKYFHSTNYETTREEPWCAAFVSYCMDQAKISSLRSARAADWISWGFSVSKPPYGSVAVMSPLVTGSSGHVGFVTGATSTHIEVLGGNQHDALNKTMYKKSLVRDYRYMNWADGSLPAEGATAVQPETGTFNAKYGVTFRSLVGGYYSADPDNLGVRRSIRTNNPGAINANASWQEEFPGFVGETPPDSSANKNRTAIYVTPEHGVAAWFYLLTKVYGFGAAQQLNLEDLARKYAGGTGFKKYVSAWTSLSSDKLGVNTVISLTDDAQVLVLGKAMFHNESGVPTPLSDVQILEGVNRIRNGLGSLPKT